MLAFAALFSILVEISVAAAFIGASLAWLVVSVGAWFVRRKLRYVRHARIGKNKRAAPRFREAARSSRTRQAASDAFALTPLRNATVLSLVFAAFSSFRLVVRKRTISSWPSSSAHAISVP